MAQPWLLVGLPAAFLILFFAVPNALLLSASFLRSEGQVMTSELTLENYALLLQQPVYLRALARTFLVGAAVGVMVCVLGFPLAWFLMRSTSRWKGPLTALCLAPLLASVVVKTYGWNIILNRFGIANDLLLASGLADQPLALMPSTAAIVVGLTHALLPYGVLTLMGAVNGINPNLERAALSLGANRTRTFLRVILPLCLPGLAAAFALSFSLSISAYATPKMLGGPQQETIATLIYSIMMTILDWPLGSTLGVVLIATSVLLAWGAARLAGGRAQPA